jgi:hypothetical protein
MALFYSAIVIILYPILESYNRELAIGFLSFRVVAIVFVIVGTILLFSILKVSQKHLKHANSEKSSYVKTGNKLKYYRDVINHGGMIVSLCLGNIALYIVLLQSKFLFI